MKTTPWEQPQIFAEELRAGGVQIAAAANGTALKRRRAARASNKTLERFREVRERAWPIKHRSS